ncbi:MAG: flavin reductase [Solirubrobacteraceae bacterium]|nr:flavin reductase [Solirubrobacteraceae bacterium]
MPSSTTSVSSRELRDAMGRFATGVAVVTARDAEGPSGATASAISSLSLDPPLVLVCLDRKSQTLGVINEAQAFAINVLAEHHQEVSNSFARSGNTAAWEAVSHESGASGAPLLDEAHAAVDCQVEQIVEGGDHQIVIGRVLEIRHPAGDARPLLYYAGKYLDLPPVEVAVEPDGLTEVEPAPPVRRTDVDPRPIDTAEATLPTAGGAFRLLAHERRGGDVTAALVYGDPAAHHAPVIHAHEACLLGDALGSLACSCRARLDAAQDAIRAAGAGVLLYTKRAADGSALRCGQGLGPDLDAGAGLLAQLGVRRAAFIDPASLVASALGTEAVAA